jgi:hypothetical protein
LDSLTIHSVATVTLLGFEGSTVISVLLHTPGTLGVSAKLSNEAVKCRNYDAPRQADRNI